MHLYLSFLAAKKRDTKEFETKPGIEITVSSEEEFRSWLGQVVVSMIDMYRQVEAHGDEEVDDFEHQLKTNSKLIDLINWIKKTSPNMAYDKEWTLVLGWGWANESGFISRYFERLNFPTVFKVLVDNTKTDGFRMWDTTTGEQVDA